MSKFLCYIYPSSLPNLARLHTEKFLVLPTKSWNDTNTCSKFTIFLDDKIRTTVQLITYTVPQNCLSLFTIHQNSLFPYVQLTGGWAFSFFVEGSHLGKIRLGTNVTRWNDILLFVVVVDVIVIFRLIRIQWLVYPLTLSFIPDWYYVISPKYKYLIE